MPLVKLCHALLSSVVFASSFVVSFLECSIAKSPDMQVRELAVWYSSWGIGEQTLALHRDIDLSATRQVIRIATAEMQDLVCSIDDRHYRLPRMLAKSCNRPHTV